MSSGEVQVILNELERIKEDIAEIKKDNKERCNTCIYVPTFKERLKSQWTHILGIWAVIGAYFGYLLLRK